MSRNNTQKYSFYGWKNGHHRTKIQSAKCQTQTSNEVKEINPKVQREP